MNISPKTKWRTSEKIALQILESLGYNVIDTHYKITITGIEIAEIDAIAVDKNTGDKYAVEIKAGRIDVNGIRQAFVNAMLVEAKPLIVCRGYADEAARILAEKLNIKVIELSDQFLVDADELENIVKTAIDEVIEKYIDLLFEPTRKLKPQYYEIVKAVAYSRNIVEASEKLGLNIKDLVKKINELKENNIIPRNLKTYKEVKRYLKIQLLKQKYTALLSELENVLNTGNDQGG